MKQKRHTTKEIIRIIREAATEDLETVCRKPNLSAASFCRWEKKFGGMEMKDAHRYRELVRENGELEKMLAAGFLKIRVLGAVNAKNGEPFAEAASRPSRSGSRAWLAQRHSRTFYIQPVSPWQNGHVESFQGSLRDLAPGPGVDAQRG